MSKPSRQSSELINGFYYVAESFTGKRTSLKHRQGRRHYTGQPNEPGLQPEPLPSHTMLSRKYGQYYFDFLLVSLNLCIQVLLFLALLTKPSLQLHFLVFQVIHILLQLAGAPLILDGQ